MRDRLMVGRSPLEAVILVRIQVPQQKMKRLPIFIFFVLIVVFVILAIFREIPVQKSVPRQVQPVVAPSAEFKQRVTQKFFGTYITPANSPIYPERFTGYHAGVDVEYTDAVGEVPVYAIADGLVVTSESASGYGGVMVIKHRINNQELYAIYGHLHPGSLLKTGTSVTRGEQIAILGTGYSQETDYERRHLHFGLALVNTITGYVSSFSQLNKTWIDPLSLY